MSTTPIDSWAVDLADVTFIYPGVGTEVAMTVFAVVLWIGWHVWQVKFENQKYEQEIKDHATEEKMRDAIDRG